jgi:hypothetical protein
VTADQRTVTALQVRASITPRHDVSVTCFARCEEGIIPAWK